MLKRFKFDQERFDAIFIMDYKIKRLAMEIDTTCKEIDRQVEEHSNETSHTTKRELVYQYEVQVATLNTLIVARNELKFEGKQIKGLDPTVIISGAVGLVGILLMLNFEKDDIINSKSLPSIGKWFGM